MSRLIRRMFDRSTRPTPKRGRGHRPVRSIADLKARLLVQPLEERAVPATYTVTNLDNANAGSLRQAILDANANPGADEIVFQAGLTGTINLLTALPVINQSLTISGPAVGGLPQITVSRDPAAATSFRIFEITDGSTSTQITVGLSNMTVSGGNSTLGAGINMANELVTLSNMVVQNNTNSSTGAGIYMTGTGTLTLTNTTVQFNNTSSTGGGIYVTGVGTLNLNNSTVQFNNGSSGGGIYMASTGAILNLDHTTVANNTASSTGGGVYSTTDSVLTITDSTIRDNRAGSGVGGGIRTSGSNLTLTRSTISGNSAGGTGGGGGIYFASTVDTAVGFFITNSTIANNTATKGGGIALASSFGGTANISSTTITANSATTASASSDTIGQGGGGISVGSASTTTSPTLFLDSTILSGNFATNGNLDAALPNVTPVAVITQYSAVGNATGFTGYFQSGTDLPVGAALGLGSLANNGGTTETVALLPGSAAMGAGNPAGPATDQRGVARPQPAGGLPDIGAFERVTGIPGAGGGPFVTITPANQNSANPYDFTVTYSDDVAINVGTIGDGDVVVTTPAGVPAVTVTLVPGSVTPNTNAPTVQATYRFTAPGGSWDPSDNGEYTISVAAGQVFNTTPGNAVPAGPLGTFQVLLSQTYTVTNTLDDGSTGSLRWAIQQANAFPGTADTINLSGVTGTISLLSALPTVSDSVTITGPTLVGGLPQLTVRRDPSAATSFRVLDISDGSTATQMTVGISNLTVSGGNTGTGAGIQVANELLTLNGVVVQNNTNTSTGAGIYMTGAGSLTLNNSRVQFNSTSSSGGGVYMSTAGAILTVDHTTVQNNTAGSLGGGLYSTTDAVVTITDSTIRNNSAGSNGGGIRMSGASFTMTRSTVSGNTSEGTNGGGGIYFGAIVGTGGFTITNSTIANNTAVRGGGIGFGTLNTVDGPVVIASSTITGNSATTGTASTATAGHGGGGINVVASSTSAGATFNVTLDNTIVSGNNAANGNHDVSLQTDGTATITTLYTAIGNATGFTNYSPSGTDLPVGSTLNLGALGPNGGPTETVPLLPGSAALNVGNPAAPTTDQRGTARPQGTAPDIGAFERVPGTPGATGAAANVSTANQNTANPYQFQVNYTADSPFLIQANTIGTGDVTVTGPNGFSVNPTVVPPAPTTNASPLAVMYQFTPPGGSWGPEDNGTYTISVNANEVQDTNNVFVPAGTVTTFSVALPFIFTVTTLADSGAGSFRQAILDSNASPVADSIVFQAGLTGTISLLSALPTINDSVTITGPAPVGGLPQISVSRDAAAATNFRVLDVSDGSTSTQITVGISNLTVSGGNTGTGAGIQVANELLTLNGVVVQNNTSASAGAGIYMTGAGTLTLNNSTVQFNSTSTTGAGIYHTGAGTVTLNDSTVQSNSTSSTGGGVYFASAGATLNVTNSTIAENTATGGGGIYFSATGSAVNLTDSTVRDNRASSSTGGGIRLTGASVAITRSTISGNSAASTTGGGGLYHTGTIGAGGFTITNSTIANNTAPRGGGIDFQSLNGTANIVSSTITANTATTASASTDTIGQGGGGINVGSSGTAPAIFLDNTILSGNNATNGNHDVALPNNGTVVVTSQYSAVGNSTGFTNYSPGTGDLAVGSAINLGALSANGGPTQTVPLLAGSAAVNTGNPAYGGAGQTDQRGTARPQGAGVDIGAFERVPGIPSATGGPFANVTPANAGTANPYQFTVTYADDTAINVSTIGTGDVTVSGPNGFTATPTLVPGSITPSTNAPSVQATYQFTAPVNGAAGWDLSDNGTYTISLAANEVFNTTPGSAVPAGVLGTFQAQFPATYTVTNLDDSGAGSLRQALTDANALPGTVDTIVFQTGLAGTISLLSALPTISDSVTITGPALAAGLPQVTVQRAAAAGTNFRIFDVTGPGTLTVAMSNLTVTGGNTGTGAGIQIADETVTLTNMRIVGNSTTSTGGGVHVSGTGAVTIADSTIANNTASRGGIYFSTAGTLTLTDSTVADNLASGQGGGVVFNASGSLTITGSTLSGNSTGGSLGGGGLYFWGTVGATGFTITNSTIANNSAVRGGGISLVSLNTANAPNARIDINSTTITANAANTLTASTATSGHGGGGIVVTSVASGGAANVNLDSTIVSGNTAANGNHDVALPTDPLVTFATQYSAVGNATGFTNYTPAATDLAVGANVNLAPLASNGGPTQTVALLAGSAAIGAGNPAGPATDQRGVARPQPAGGLPDIGAFERVPGIPAAVPGSFVDVTPANAASANPYQFTVTYFDDVAINTSTIDANDVSVAVPAGVPAVTVSVANVNSTNPMAVVVTYQFTAPGGSWDIVDNGTYTVSLNAGQVLNTNTVAVPGGEIGSFQAAFPFIYTVTTLADSGPGSLRQAIIDSNALPSPDAIQFNPALFNGGPATITLLSALPTISDSLVIAGPGANLLTVNANGTGRVFTITGAGILQVTLSGMQVTGGLTTANGGGVYADDDNVTLDRMYVHGNTADMGGGVGGGDAGGTVLTILNSTISGNTATVNSTTYGGGGIFIDTTADMTIVNSTIANNRSNGTGGGITAYAFSGELVIKNSTIVNNSSVNEGGGIRTTSATPAITLVSSIVAGNTGGASSPDIANANVVSTNSAIGSTSGMGTGGSSSGDLPVGSFLDLQPLANYGGPMPTVALGSGSLAINAGSNPDNLPFDQRGFARVVGPAADIGAFESGAVAPATVTSVVVNGGGAQRSEVRSVVVTFSQVVNFAGGNANAAAAFTLSRLTGGGNVGLAASVATVGTQTVVTLTFTNANPAVVDAVSATGGASPSLADGRYQLAIADGAVTSAATGQALDGDANGTAGGAFVSPPDTAGSGAGLFFGLYRLFGDATGNGLVDLADLAEFRSTFNQTAPNPAYLAYLDADNSNTVDLADLSEFRSRFNQNLFI